MARRLLIAATVVAAGLLGCTYGSRSVQVAEDDPHHRGAVLFAERCGSCHTLEAAGTQGSATDVADRENVDGPNFDSRKENVDDVLYAIRNGGFSGAIMPENIVTGQDAQNVADFLAKYAGREAAGRNASSGDNTTGR
jgi:mono/diheme cytochrome c family protein